MTEIDEYFGRSLIEAAINANPADSRRAVTSDSRPLSSRPSTATLDWWDWGSTLTTTSTTTGTTLMGGYAKPPAQKTRATLESIIVEIYARFERDEAAAIVAAIIDTVLEQGRPDRRGSAEPVEPEPDGFLHVPEGARLGSALWTGSSTSSPPSTIEVEVYGGGTYTLAYDEF